MSFSGHLPKILGDDAEEAFYRLTTLLGYTKDRTQNITPAIDLIAEFDDAESQERSSLLKRPIFSPNGITAFSVKRGQYKLKDVANLKRDIEKGKRSKDKKDEVLRNLAGGVLVTGSLLPEPELNSILKEDGIYIWDIRRLIFYSLKVKICEELSELGAVKEGYFQSLNGSFVIAPTKLDIATMYVRVFAFLDDHNLVVQRDHAMKMLMEIYSRGLKPFLSSSPLSLQVILSVHSMGSVRRELVKEAYVDYAKALKKHPRVFFSTPDVFEIQSYAAAPWTAIFSPSTSATLSQ